MLRIDPTGTMFTSSHLLLATLAHETGCTEPALRVINKELTSYPGMPSAKDPRPLADSSLPPTMYISTTSGLTRHVKSTTVLEYNLVCGLIHISRRNWPQAQRFLEQVITHPSRDRGVSKIMVETYKKWLLVGLLCEGKEPKLPSYTTSSAKQAYTILCGPYISLASLFATPHVDELMTEADAHRAIFEEDSNRSLVAEVLSAYQKWQIINLRQCYLQIPVTQIQKSTCSALTGQPLESREEVVSLIRDMIESNMLLGELQPATGGDDDYLAFHSDRALMTETDFAREIARSHASIIRLGKDYQTVNERLSGHKEYVKYVVREAKRTEKEEAEDPFESQIEDEDLMTGIIAHG